MIGWTAVIVCVALIVGYLIGWNVGFALGWKDAFATPDMLDAYHDQIDRLYPKDL